MEYKHSKVVVVVLLILMFMSPYMHILSYIGQMVCPNILNCLYSIIAIL